jgi:hypothetical protein
MTENIFSNLENSLKENTDNIIDTTVVGFVYEENYDSESAKKQKRQYRN